MRSTVDITDLMERCAACSDAVNARLKEETGEDSVYALAAKTLRDTAPNWRVEGDAVGWSGDAVDFGGVDFSNDDFWGSGMVSF